jgi:hypothetical protein
MFSIDWLSIVLDDDREEIIEYISTRLSEVIASQCKIAGGVHGYEQSRRGEGWVLAWGGEFQRNTLLLSLSGEACNVLSWYGCAALCRALIKRFSVKLKFSRVDLALDVVGEWWQYFDSPDRVFELLQDARVKTVEIINDYERQVDLSGYTENWIVTGHTTYIGSRTSERFMRIYKKDKDTGEHVTRFEYELKGRYASVVGAMLLGGELLGSAYIFANVNHIDLTSIYDLTVLYDAPALSLPRRKERRTFQWLMSLSKLIYEFINNNPEMWQRVIDEGSARSPVGNTGVHIQEPKEFTELFEKQFNYDTFGSTYHPLYPVFSGQNYKRATTYLTPQGEKHDMG